MFNACAGRGPREQSHITTLKVPLLLVDFAKAFPPLLKKDLASHVAWC